MKKTQFAEKVKELGYHVTEHIHCDIGYMCVWKHGDYVCKINYRSNYVINESYNIPDDIKKIMADYADL